MDCEHLIENVKINCQLFDEDIAITKNLDCSVCSSKDHNWMCLHCGAVNCGRYVNGHAKVHAEDQGHQICISLEEYSVYCYKCDEYVINDTDDQSIDKIRQRLKLKDCTSDKETQSTYEAKQASFPSSLLPSNELSSSSLEPSNENSMDVAQPTPPRSRNNSPNSCSLEANEQKSPGTLKNTEETGRSLRPRSQKRSHSEESLNENQSSSKNSLKKYCSDKSQREKKVVGLKNLGNTCFMNAVLQSLSNIQEFSCYFNTLPSLENKQNGKKVYHSRSITRQEVHDVVMAEELRKVLRNLNTGGCGTKGAISPECLFLVIWKVVPRFRGYQQQDAHEFLRYMLDRLHTELQQLLPSDGIKDGTYYSMTQKNPCSIVTAVFGGTLQSEVRCLACGTESKKFDPFLDLSLELPETSRHDAPVTLAECLASFVQIEELADTERYFCSSCKCKQKSTKQFWIRRLPNVLCLHLKRFRWNNYFRTKVDTSITFPLSALDMSAFVLSNLPETRRSGSNHLYDLAAVIVHHGSGAGSGHYTAFAINEEQWFHFNDQTVRATDAETVASCKPYILFYIRRELSLPPLPHPRRASPVPS